MLHLLIALGGYLRHGDYVTPNILDTLPQSAAVGAARLAIVFAFAFTYPMMIFLCRMHIGAITARRARLRFSLWGVITAAGAAHAAGEEAGEEAALAMAWGWDSDSASAWVWAVLGDSSPRPGGWRTARRRRDGTGMT